MDRDYINEHQIIERYLQDRLSEDERAAFEAAYLSSPELVDELETAERLQEGLRDLSLVQQARPASRATSRWTDWLRSPQYAMAASVALFISLGVTGTLMQRRSQSDDPFATHIQPLVTTRSAAGEDLVNVVERGVRRMHFVLMVDPGFTPYSSYRATVLREAPGGAGTPVWQLDGLSPGYEDMLAIGLPASVLVAGDYVLRLEGRQDDWPANRDYDRVSELTFAVVEPQ